MKLRRLRLLNFRQHARTEIEFRSGLTGIIGPNGAGKSTLLEAIAWAIYGAPAARGTNDTIRFVRASPRSPVESELEFELGGREYRVVRTLTSADVFVDGHAAPAATTLRGATDYLQQRLGMSRDEFFHTYFTGQKDLQFLTQLGPAERGQFLAQVLGYARLRSAQGQARARRRELGHEIDGVRAALPDPATLRTDLEAATGRRESLLEVLEGARAELGAATSALEVNSPRWAAAQAAHERLAELEHRREMAAQEYRGAARRLVRATEEMEEVAGAEAELGRLRAALEPLPALARANERFARMAILHERRAALEEAVSTLRPELAAATARRDRLERAPDFAARFRDHLSRLRGELAAQEQVVERERDAWQQDRQEVRTRLETYTDRTAELQQQLDQLRDAGPEGECPTCARPLRDHFDRVMSGLEDEWESLVQDGKWLKKREEQLKAKPATLAAAEDARASLQARVGRMTEKLRRSEQAIEEQPEVEKAVLRMSERLESLEAELSGLTAGYDPAAHRTAAAELAALREVERRAAGLEEKASRRGRVEKERDEALALRDAAAGRGREVRAAIESLGHDPERYLADRSEQAMAEERARRAELAVTEARGRIESAEEAVTAARRAVSRYEEQKARVDRLEIERSHHEELDKAFSRLRAELNARVRPELADVASGFLADITGGRYTALEIDERYNVLVLDDGEEKPVISGGEEDVANLVLRLAISQMMAERAGHPLSVLILDEVFASLDIDRRDAVIQLLRALTDRFEQVILISHIEGMWGALDHVIECSYDEASGASRVRAHGVGALLEPQATQAAGAT
jgi:DNA repair protein SbcC/Rad50